MRVGALDDLAIHFKDKPHDAMRRRMLRTEIHHEVSDARRPFELTRRSKPLVDMLTAHGLVLSVE
jgi:hypothetical protein